MTRRHQRAVEEIYEEIENLGLAIFNRSIDLTATPPSIDERITEQTKLCNLWAELAETIKTSAPKWALAAAIRCRVSYEASIEHLRAEQRKAAGGE